MPALHHVNWSNQRHRSEAENQMLYLIWGMYFGALLFHHVPYHQIGCAQIIKVLITQF